MQDLTRGRRNEVIAFFVLTFVLSWAIWFPVMTQSLGLPGFAFPPAGLVGALGPGIAAIAIVLVRGGWPELRKLAGGLGVWRVGLRWYLAVLLVPALVAAVFVGSAIWRGAWLPAPSFGAGALAFMILIQVPNTLFEEIGWRGFALPRMMPSLGWLGSSLVLGVIWATWHLPYWVSAPNVHQYGFASIALFFAMPVSASVFMALMYRQTHGSVLLTWLTHLAINVTIAFMPLSSEQIGDLWPQAAYTIGIVVIGVYSAVKLMSRRPQFDRFRFSNARPTPSA